MNVAGNNADAIVGGLRLWSQPEWTHDKHWREEPVQTKR